MPASFTDLATKPLAIFLREHFAQLTSVFKQAESSYAAFLSTLRENLHSWLYSLADDRFLPFLLVDCQALPQLNREHLARILETQLLPTARFMSEPPAHFDSVLVPAGEDAPGSGYIWYFKEGLTIGEIYYLLSHVYGHLALGHIRRGDLYSHYDVLADLQAPTGPARRWDQAVQDKQRLWFTPLFLSEEPIETWPLEWRLPGFAEAFERIQNQQLDESSLAIQIAAARYSTHLFEVDFSLQHDAQLFPHQIRGAAELAVRLQKLGVALLADSVGLGKTRTVATVIRLLRQYGRIRQAAIFTPSKLERNWQEELRLLRLKIGKPGDRDADVIIINKDKFKRLEPSEARQQVRGCDLLVIEEAHQDMRHSSNKFHRNIREVSARKYGLLVTATPWNNRRGDIFTMLQPFAANSPGSEVPAQAFRCFSTVKTGQKEFEQDDQLFRQVYRLTTLQRTRRQLRESGDNSVFYAPRRPYLISVPYTPEQRAAFATLLDHIEGLCLPHFNPVRYLASADAGENRLSGIHRFVLLKRAESSMEAFERSLDALAGKAGAMHEELANITDTDFAIASWLRQRYALEETAAEEEPELETSTDILMPPRKRYGRIKNLIDQADQSGQLRALRQTLLEDCNHDVQVVQQLRQDFHSLFTKDPKLEVVLNQIHTSLAAGHKVICISQFADTAQVVYRVLINQPVMRQKGVGLVMSSTKDPLGACQINGQPASRSEVLNRFAPHSWARAEYDKPKQAIQQPKSSELAILVGTDTLSVGQNLQDARVLINLDLCWNPMLHEQRIGRIDRPRHSSDGAPLDIFYLLNLDLIEAELKLRETIEKRLAGTYQDTAFDDEILPGYFEMIEHFRRLRREQPASALYVDEANELLELLAERSARPPETTIPNDELEREALRRLQEAASHFPDQSLSTAQHLLITMGRIPLYNHLHILRSNPTHMELLAETAFQPVDQQGHPVGHTTYRHFSLALHTAEPSVDQPLIKMESESIVPFIDGLLAEPIIGANVLSHAHLTKLQLLLRTLEDKVLQEQALQNTILTRAQRYRRFSHIGDEADPGEEAPSAFTDGNAERIVASLASVRLIV